MAVAGAALPTALLHKGLQVIFSLAAVFCFGFQAEYPPPGIFFQCQDAILLAIFIIKESMLFYHIFCNRTRAIPHNSKCRYGERGAAAAKPKAQIILDVLSSILATQMPCRTPSRSEALRSATAACGGSWRGDPPERCLSRQAGIMRCCPWADTACPTRCTP